MPYCTHCGGQVKAGDGFCAACGGAQPGAAASNASTTASGPQDFLSSIPPRTAALLCYIPVMGWVAAVVVLAARRFREDRTIRFHAFQGLYLFVAWLVLDWTDFPFFWHRSAFLPFGLTGMLKAAIFGAWIFMIYKTSRNEDFHLPLFGHLAERSLSEQR